MLIRTLAVALALCCLPLDLIAQATWSRADAVERLESQDAAVRHAAIVRLAQVGTESDATPLLSRLRDREEPIRALAEQAIWTLWGRSGDERIDRLLEEGSDQMQSGRLDEAIATFTRIIEARPAFAEGWNKRATAWFLAGKLDLSLKDCDEVIKRNPWHFGVLAGYGQIHARRDEYARALSYFRRAIAINPNMDGVRMNIEGLEAIIARKERGTV